MQKEVVLSDGNPCAVRALGIFELEDEGVAPEEMPGPFFYQYETVTGEVVRDIYDLSAITKPPPKPDTPKDECDKGSVGWHQWAEHETYTAALAHHEWSRTVLEKYAKDVKRYILKQSVAKENRSRIVTDEDMEAVEQAALIPQMTEEAISAALSRSFPGAVRQS